MAKGSGSTRASASSSPRGLGRMESAASRLNAQYDIAERLYANRELTVDPGDAVYESARALTNRQIEDSIEYSTDYIAQVTRDGYVSIQSQYTEEQDAINRFGTERVRIPMEERSLMDIIQELRTSNESDIFNKYKRY